MRTNKVPFNDKFIVDLGIPEIAPEMGAKWRSKTREATRHFKHLYPQIRHEFKTSGYRHRTYQTSDFDKKYYVRHKKELWGYFSGWENVGSGTYFVTKDGDRYLVPMGPVMDGNGTRYPLDVSNDGTQALYQDIYPGAGNKLIYHTKIIRWDYLGLPVLETKVYNPVDVWGGGEWDEIIPIHEWDVATPTGKENHSQAHLVYHDIGRPCFFIDNPIIMVFSETLKWHIAAGTDKIIFGDGGNFVSPRSGFSEKHKSWESISVELETRARKTIQSHTWEENLLWTDYTYGNDGGDPNGFPQQPIIVARIPPIRTHYLSDAQNTNYEITKIPNRCYHLRSGWLIWPDITPDKPDTGKWKKKTMGSAFMANLSSDRFIRDPLDGNNWKISKPGPNYHDYFSIKMDDKNVILKS